MSGCKRKKRDGDFVDVDNNSNSEPIRDDNMVNLGAFAMNYLSGPLNAVKYELKLVCNGVENIAKEVAKIDDSTKLVDNGEARMHAQISSLLEDVKSKDKLIKELETKLESAKKKEESWKDAVVRLTKVHDDIAKKLGSTK
jgi:uncharacterized protein YhaN